MTDSYFSESGGSRKAIKRLEAQERDPDLKAVLDKMVRDTMGGRRNEPGQGANPPSQYLIRKLSNIASQNITDANTLFQMLPDMELAKQILVSSILSPKDLVNTEINYRVQDGVLDSALSSRLLGVISDYFDKTYKIRNDLSTILENILFMKGSHPMVVLAESTIDQAVNGTSVATTESISAEFDRKGRPRPLGILGPASGGTPKVGLENMFERYDPTTEDLGVDVQGGSVGLLSVTDNPSALKMSKITDKIRTSRINNLLGVHNRVSTEARRAKKETESDKAQTARAITEKVYGHRRYQNNPILPLRGAADQSKDTVGHPLVMSLPPEAIIPVHVPGDPTDHVGYFAILDNEGHPINTSINSNHYQELTARLGDRQNEVSQTIQSTYAAMYGEEKSDSQIDIEEATRIYSSLVEEDLLCRLKNGAYGENVEIARPQEIYRIMLARACARQGTQLLYLPAEIVTYMAFDYNEYGIGISLLEKTKILASIRSMLLFANTMAGIKNSVGRTGLRIELDPNDPDPQTTVEMLLHRYTETRTAAYPIGANNPNDIIDYLGKAGVDLNVSGNTRYPETTMEVEDRSSQKAPVDTELEEKMRQRHLQAIGISPEVIDATLDIDFATSIVSSNVLLSKRVMAYQSLLTGFLHDFISKYTMNDGTLKDELYQAIDAYKGSEEAKETEDNKIKDLEDEEIVFRFLEALIIELPMPDTVTLDNQLEAFDSYNRALDAALNAYVSEDYLERSVVGDLADYTRQIVAAVRAYFQRQWLRNNNMLTELDDLIQQDKEGNVLVDVLKRTTDHINVIEEKVAEFVKDMNEKQASFRKNAGLDEGDAGAGDGAQDDTSSSNDTGGGGGFGGGFDF